MTLTATAATLALFSTSLVQALPRSLVPNGPGGALPIRDVARLAELEALHNETLADLKAGHFSTIQRRGEQALDNDIEKRNPEVLAGMLLSSRLSAEIIKRIYKNLKDVFDTDNHETWFNENRCRTSFRTNGGVTEGIWSYDKGFGYRDPSGSHVFEAAWIDPENNDPPVHYYSDKGIGDFSVQFTATDSYAWDGIDGTKNCPFQGLCNPQFVFYRDRYNIIFSTWFCYGMYTSK
ncbi:uncharacterized protein B0I36DRAFT_363242 [Microdochium trichocladiopsis]|uniref:Uncharacterized protein n=1 Tax=Microdochium trichocladiopsis TaxID=1682393 RepID=A0A9P8Y790_9PEZI|nr:uncharacterized protein B0I36DRAFT_363242 [Microdochium trichocladiopsis]KAH7031569.1 hypothetical protein B0I36DRAFT_363242 [Microdochium trichocladiopsis]